MTVVASSWALVDGQAMCWDEYVALGGEPRAEYVDGEGLASPRPNTVHQQLGFRLAIALEAVTRDDLEVTLDWSWKVGGDELAPAAAGLPHHWIVDPRDEVMDAFELVDGVYVATAHVTADAPAKVSFGPVSLHVDPRELTVRRRLRG